MWEGDMSIFDRLRAGVCCETAEDTMKLGEHFASVLPDNQVIALHGDLGTGKTTFVKGVGRALGIAPESVTSPTYNIYTLHRGNRQLVHIDGYRLEGHSAEHLLIEEFLEEPWLVAVEWPERALTHWMDDVLWQLEFERELNDGVKIRLMKSPLTESKNPVKHL